MKSPNRLPAALRRCQRYGIPAAFIFALMFHGLLPSGGWCFEVRELLAWMGQAFIWGLTLAAPLLVAASTSTAVGGIQSSGFCRVGRVFLAFILSTFLCAMAGALAAGSVEMTYPDLSAELGVRQDPTAAAGWSQMLPVLPVMPKLLMPGAVAAALGTRSAAALGGFSKRACSRRIRRHTTDGCSALLSEAASGGGLLSDSGGPHSRRIFFIRTIRRCRAFSVGRHAYRSVGH